MAQVIAVGTARETERAGFTQRIPNLLPALYWDRPIAGYSPIEARAIAQVQRIRKTQRFRVRNRPRAKVGG